MVCIAPAGVEHVPELGVPVGGVEVADHHHRSVGVAERRESTQLIAPLPERCHRARRVHDEQRHLLGRIDDRRARPESGIGGVNFRQWVAAPNRRPAGARLWVLDSVRILVGDRTGQDDRRVFGRVFGEREHVGVERGERTRDVLGSRIGVEQIAVENPEWRGAGADRRLARGEQQRPTQRDEHHGDRAGRARK